MGKTGLVGFACLLVTAGCGAPGPPATGQAAEAPGAVKRITAALLRMPADLRADPSGEIRDLLTTGLAVQDNRGNLVPRLGEAVPSIENGLWKVFPDGRMETTWRLKQGARWHDGAPFTVHDLVFATIVEQNPQHDYINWPEYYRYVEQIEAPDDYTVTVKWSGPHVEAHQLFTRARAPGFPLPKHILEKDFSESPATLMSLPYWTTGYVGTGPFKLREWAPDSHVSYEANDQYLLGRPKIDEIVVKFFADSNTLMANILAGEIDMTLGAGMTTDQQVELERNWKLGTVGNEARDRRFTLFPQYRNPSPPEQADVRFRRALVHALDRQAMTDSLQHGLFPVPHAPISVNHLWYKEIEPFIVKYDYDPQRAFQLLEEVGYRRGADGFLHDGAGRPLITLQLFTGTGIRLHENAMLTTADYWQRVGVPMEAFVPRRTTTGDRANRSGFYLQREALRVTGSQDLRAKYYTPAPTRGENRAYSHPELDALLDRFVTTIPPNDRLKVLGPIIHHISDQVVDIPLLYDGEPMAIAHRLVNVFPLGEDNSPAVWNILDWDVR